MQVDITKHWGDNEIWHQAELSSKIIASMQKHGKVILVSMESRSLKHSGLSEFLDTLCSFWNWNPKDIVIASNNLFETSSKFTVEKMFIPCVFLDNTHPRHTPWDGSKSYGMFLGRATAERLQAVSRHQTFDFRAQGLTSFHHDVKKHIDTNELVKYLSESDSRYSELLKLTAFSDIGQVDEQIIGQHKTQDWTSVYKQIALELVFETSTADDVITVSEKILRPMQYGRPFMLIGSRRIVQKLSHPELLAEYFSQLAPKSYHAEFVQNFTGIRFFKNVFGTDYDNDSGLDRVNHVFDILHTLIRNNQIHLIHDKCRQDIEHNHQCVLLLQTMIKKMGGKQNIVNYPYAYTKI